MLKRKVMQKLIDWQERRHGMCAVLPEGDRRVGKIALVKAFGEGRYDSFLLVDCFELPAEVRRIFEGHSDDLDTFFLMPASYYRRDCIGGTHSLFSTWLGSTPKHTRYQPGGYRGMTWFRV